MTDTLDPFVYPNNDDTIIVRPSVFRANATTGLDETVTLTGRTDGVAFLSLSSDPQTATAIAGCTVALSEIASTGTYTAVMEGLAKATAFASLADGRTLWRHVQFGDDYRTATAVTLKKRRES